MTFLAVLLLTLFVFIGGAFAQASENTTPNLRISAALAADSGSYDTARTLYQQELDRLFALGDQAEAGAVYTELGEVDQIHGAFAMAEASYKKGVDLLKRYAQPNDLRLVSAIDDLGWLYISWGRLMDGSRLMDMARSKAAGAKPNDPRLIQHLDTQAAYLVVSGRYSEAQRVWSRALKIGELNYGPGGREYDNILVHRGQASALCGDYELAEEMFRQYLQIEGRVSNGRTVSYAVAAGELAHVYTQRHKFTEARPWFDGALGVFNNNQDSAPLVHSMLLNYFGDFYMGQQEWSNAVLQYRQALNIQQKVLGDHHAVATSMISLSKALQKLHLKDEAKDLVTRAKAISAAEKNSFQAQTVDVLALRRQ
jgi:tetratricopeptide (TPR) repeat protein